MVLLSFLVDQVNEGVGQDNTLPDGSALLYRRPCCIEILMTMQEDAVGGW